MPAGSFIISLDCEAKWGLADHLDARHQAGLVDAAIRRTYERLVAIFGTYDVPATFAFVAIFLMNRTQGRELLETIAADDGSALSRWLSAYRTEWAAGTPEGWHMPELAEIVATGGHEIAAHGLTHLPLGQSNVSDEEAEREIVGARQALARLGHEPQTFIFARNEQKCVPAITRAGYRGYRDSRAAQSRAITLASEFIPAMRSERSSDGPVDAAVSIPAGRFLNFHFGPRSFVPRAVSARRWKTAIDHAAHSDGVAHLWFHPHNLLFDPDAGDVLASILSHAAALRDKGKLRVETQIQYAERKRRDGQENRARR